MAYLVELHHDCWLAKTDGDPGRTLVIEHAQRFKTEPAARGALTRARRYRPYKAARIVEHYSGPVLSKRQVVQRRACRVVAARPSTQ